MFDFVEKHDKATTDGKTTIAFGKGGFQGARGSYGNSGTLASTGRMADSFFVENIFEELDAVGSGICRQAAETHEPVGDKKQCLG